MLLSIGSACLRPIPLHGCFCLSFCLSVFLSFLSVGLFVCLADWLRVRPGIQSEDQNQFFTFEVRTFWQSEVKISVLALWLGALSSLFHNMGVGGMDVTLCTCQACSEMCEKMSSLWMCYTQICPRFECRNEHTIHMCVYCVLTLNVGTGRGVCVGGGGGCVWGVCVCVGVCLSVGQSVCRSVCLSVGRSVGLSVCLSVGLSVCLHAFAFDGIFAALFAVLLFFEVLTPMLSPEITLSLF